MSNLERITITETTVGMLGDVRVGVGNVWEDQGPDDNLERAVRATLAVMGEGKDDFDQRVATGDVVWVAGQAWSVTSVHEPPSGLGAVTLERAPGLDPN